MGGTPVELDCGCVVEMRVTIKVVLGEIYVKDIVGGTMVKPCARHKKPRNQPKKKVTDDGKTNG